MNDRYWICVLAFALAGCGIDTNRPLTDPGCDLEAAFGAPQPFTELNTGLSEWSASLTDDELEVVFLSDRVGTMWSPEIWTATRKSRSAPWENIHMISKLASLAGQESGLAISGDGLDLYFSLLVTPTRKLYRAHRASRAHAFSPPEEIAQQNDLYEFEIALAPSNNLYASARSPTADNRDVFLYPFDGKGWSSPVVLDGVASITDETGMAISKDERTLFFARQVAKGVAETSETWIAQRASTSEPFAALKRLDELTFVGGGTIPSWVSSDGCRLYVAMYSPDPRLPQMGRGWYDLAVASKPAKKR